MCFTHSALVSANMLFTFTIWILLKLHVVQFSFCHMAENVFTQFSNDPSSKFIILSGLPTPFKSCSQTSPAEVLSLLLFTATFTHNSPLFFSITFGGFILLICTFLSTLHPCLPSSKAQVTIVIEVTPQSFASSRVLFLSKEENKGSNWGLSLSLTPACWCLAFSPRATLLKRVSSSTLLILLFFPNHQGHSFLPVS